MMHTLHTVVTELGIFCIYYLEQQQVKPEKLTRLWLLSLTWLDLMPAEVQTCSWRIAFKRLNKIFPIKWQFK